MTMLDKNTLPAKNISSSVSYRVEIDGLRALAVMAVIANHFNKNLLPSGYLGVDIFFVISGFLITSSLVNHSNKNFINFLTEFYVRRTKRLVPALVVCVAITSILLCFFSPNPEISLKTGFLSLFGLSNLYLLQQSTDYFAASTELNVFTHTWSLGVEQQFYLLFPLLAWFTGFSRLATRGSRNLFLVTGAALVASLISFVYLYQFNQSAAYFLTPTRFWELAVGCLLFIVLSNSTFFRPFEAIPPLLLIFSLVSIFFVPLKFAVLATVAVVVLTAILIGCIRPKTAAYALLTQNQLVAIGVLSYSLYLWHWAVLSLSRWTIGTHWWSVPFQLVLILLLAIISYRYIETPLRRYQWSSHSHMSLVYGLSASLLAGLFIVVISLNAQKLSLIEENKEMLYKTHWEGWETCDYVQSQDPESGGCQHLKNKDFPRRIVVIGDSHAGHLASGLRYVSESIPSSISILLYAGCYPIKNSECSLISQAYTWTLDQSEVDLVILSTYHNLVTHGNRLYQATENPSATLNEAMDNLEEDLRESIKSLTDSGKKVLMIVDSHELLLNPILEIIPMSGLVRRHGSLDVSYESVVARNKDYYSLLDRISAQNPDFTVFYSGSVFCKEGICQSDINRMPLFQTEDHLTPLGSKTLAVEYQDVVKTLLDASQ